MNEKDLREISEEQSNAFAQAILKYEELDALKMAVGRSAWARRVATKLARRLINFHDKGYAYYTTMRFVRWIADNGPTAEELDDSCFLCKAVNDQYMVHSWVWGQVVEKVFPAVTRENVRKVHRLLCIKCLEQQLGRPLTQGDFTEAPINNLVRWALQKNETEGAVKL